ncbi:lactonase family protein [Rufibacter latericius]|uniref:Lactonase family protein n=1 Tax=Rufibacter latericius TaxID=2487040 RepID=A0A3M9N103_9BACT|nr:lactonase family protein [Rufibacter latericius]RNI31479.1 lactonase family protein [Rufibacter latericius]
MKTLTSLLLGLSIILAACTSVKQKATQKDMMVYIGTYAKPDAESIFAYNLNEETGALTRSFAVKAGENPSFLTLDADRKHLYAVNETTEFEGQKSGAVSAFAIDQKTGNLTFLNRQPSLGGAPCYISLDHKNKVALVANYVGGNISTFLLQEDGRLGSSSDMEQHQGKGPRPQQDAAHAHCILPDPENNFALAVDLGIDQIISYRLNKSDGKLERQSVFTAKSGAGPRHLTFHPKNKRFAYVINELNSTLTTFTYNPDNGTLTEVETVPTLPVGYTGENACADIHVSADGKFLYGSNRGHNSIVVFSINQDTNKLTLVQHMATQVNWPRNFTFSPSGRTMLVANQKSNSITTYKVDAQTGKLTYTGNSAAVPSPVYVQVVPAFPETPKP